MGQQYNGASINDSKRSRAHNHIRELTRDHDLAPQSPDYPSLLLEEQCPEYHTNKKPGPQDAALSHSDDLDGW